MNGMTRIKVKIDIKPSHIVPTEDVLYKVVEGYNTYHQFPVGTIVRIIGSKSIGIVHIERVTDKHRQYVLMEHLTRL